MTSPCRRPTPRCHQVPRLLLTSSSIRRSVRDSSRVLPLSHPILPLKLLNKTKTETLSEDTGIGLNAQTRESACEQAAACPAHGGASASRTGQGQPAGTEYPGLRLSAGGLGT